MIGCGITTYNRPEADEKLVESLNEANTKNICFYVFNDNKTVPKAFLELKKTPLYVFCHKHKGLPVNIWECINTVFANHNVGFFLENDVAVAKDYFTHMLKILEDKGGVVASNTYWNKGNPIEEADAIAGNNWCTTRDVWIKTKPILEPFIEDMREKDYLSLDGGWLTNRYGAATQDCIRAKAFKEAGYKIWKTNYPKARITVPDGVHGASYKQIQITQKEINEADSNHPSLLGR